MDLATAILLLIVNSSIFWWGVWFLIWSLR